MGAEEDDGVHKDDPLQTTEIKQTGKTLSGGTGSEGWSGEPGDHTQAGLSEKTRWKIGRHLGHFGLCQGPAPGAVPFPVCPDPVLTAAGELLELLW